jgi:hypothetical protein
MELGATAVSVSSQMLSRCILLWCVLLGSDVQSELSWEVGNMGVSEVGWNERGIGIRCHCMNSNQAKGLCC